MSEFKKDPKGFAEAIFNGISQANYSRQDTPVPFDNHANYIHVQPSRHADDETVYLHSGNSVTNINYYSPDFENLVQRNPEWAIEIVDRAMQHLKDVKAQIKKNQINTPV
jgi:hypothetical protein